ncbi:MAG: hypothetical protein JNK64_20785 [Myxococcales bacterium]|nr:hypothetical protein [Myxococcales bacterium]
MGEKDPTRRASDDTRGRIDQLAGGWDLGDRPPAEPDPAPAEPAPPAPAPVRSKGPTQPPPVPPRRDRPSAPPPPPPAAAAPAPPPAPPPPIIIGGDDDATDADRDATRVDPRSDATVMAAAERATLAAGATLPVRAAFRRRRGLGGDVVYVATVLFRGAATRRELRRIEAAVDERAQARAAALIALGADGIGDPALDGAAIDAARDQLAALEEERAARAGEVAAADADAATIERNRKGELDKQAEAQKAAEAELAAIAGRLAPLVKEAEAVRKKGDELRATLARQDDLLRAQDAKAVAMRGKAERAAVDAEIATLRADRVAIAKDEPALAAQLAELAPRIAALEAERAAAQGRQADARAAAAAAGERAVDEQAAVTARKKVIERGVAELEKRRDRALRQVGEALAIARPPSQAAALARLDEVELAAAGEERRAMELREMLATVDKPALARGLAVMLLLAAVVGAALWFALLR